MISNLAGWRKRLDGFLMVFYISLEYTTEKVRVFIETNMYGIGLKVQLHRFLQFICRVFQRDIFWPADINDTMPSKNGLTYNLPGVKTHFIHFKEEKRIELGSISCGRRVFN